MHNCESSPNDDPIVVAYVSSFGMDAALIQMRDRVGKASALDSTELSTLTLCEFQGALVERVKKDLDRWNEACLPLTEEWLGARNVILQTERVLDTHTGLQDIDGARQCSRSTEWWHNGVEEERTIGSSLSCRLMGGLSSSELLLVRVGTSQTWHALALNIAGCLPTEGTIVIGISGFEVKQSTTCWPLNNVHLNVEYRTVPYRGGSAHLNRLGEKYLSAKQHEEPSAAECTEPSALQDQCID